MNYEIIPKRKHEMGWVKWKINSNTYIKLLWKCSSD